MAGGPMPGSGRPGFDYYVNGKRFEDLASAAEVHKVSTTTIHNWCSDGKKSKENCWKEPKTSKALDNIKKMAKEAGMMPLDFMLKFMRDETQDLKFRAQLAFWAAKYVHPIATEKKGKKPEREDRAKKAGSGKFSPSKTPHLKVAK